MTQSALFAMCWFPSEQYPNGIRAVTTDEMRAAMLQHGYPEFIWIIKDNGDSVCLKLEAYQIEYANAMFAEREGKR